MVGQGFLITLSFVAHVTNCTLHSTELQLMNNMLMILTTCCCTETDVHGMHKLEHEILVVDL